MLPGGDLDAFESVNLGGVSLLPHLPLPAKLRTRILTPMRARPREDSEAYAGRTQATMQRALDEMTANRRPLFG